MAAPGLQQLHVGLMAANGAKGIYGGGNVPETEAQFDNLVVTSTGIEREGLQVDPDAAYSTTFASAEEFEAECEVKNRDDTHLGFSNGLNLVTQYGTFSDEEKPVKNLALLRQELPGGDFEIEVQVTGRVHGQYNEFGIILYQDDGNHLRLVNQSRSEGGYAWNERVAFFKTVRNEESAHWVGWD